MLPLDLMTTLNHDGPSLSVPLSPPYLPPCSIFLKMQKHTVACSPACHAPLPLFLALSLEAAVAAAEVDKKANENEKDEAASRIIGNINEIFEWNNASPSAAHFFYE